MSSGGSSQHLKYEEKPQIIELYHGGVIESRRQFGSEPGAIFVECRPVVTGADDARDFNSRTHQGVRIESPLCAGS